MSRHFLFIDESGDHGLTSLNNDFPVFLLCGVLISEAEYLSINAKVDALKKEFWGNKSVIFHSRDIRKCDKEFQILFDLELKARFYERLNAIFRNSQYTIIASAIKKNDYIKKHGLLSNDVYELALSFMIERSVFYLDGIVAPKSLQIASEKRGRKEDKKLDEHFQRLLSRGTGYVAAERLKSLGIGIHFKSKKENISGLQLADLIAYPIARYVIDQTRANPAFDIIAPKIYTKGGKRHGLKIFP